MLSFTIKFIFYVIILSLLVVLLTKEEKKGNNNNNQFQNSQSGRLKKFKPKKVYTSRTQEFDANAQLRGNVIKYFDGYLMNQIKFDSPRIDMNQWAKNQKKQDVKRVLNISKIANESMYQNLI